ncbi:MAG: histidinol-phosphate transaminase [Myxococcales bacterium]|nr:histidinol-phosphate transaminase [Myxococcales bacterium]
MKGLESLVPDEVARIAPYAAPVPRPRHVRLDANESPWPLPDALRSRLAERLAQIDLHRYPDPRARGLRARLAEREGGEPDEYVIGCGSDEIIALLCCALGRPPAGRDRAAVLVPWPSFVMYAVTARVHGLDVVEVPLRDDFALDETAMREAIARERPNLVFLASPNNPTGNAFESACVEGLVDAFPEVLFVLDGAYGAYADAPTSRLAPGRPNVARMGTLSKVGLAAARVGWVRLPGNLASYVDRARQPFNLSTLAQVTAELALDEWTDLVEPHARAVVAERRRLLDALGSIAGLRPWPSQANFVLVGVEHPIGAGGLVEALEKRGLLVRSCAGWGGRMRDMVRITVGTPAENDALLDALREILH